MSARICLVTTGQPACNPRLAKEADALTAAGFDVHVVATYSADWATDADRELARSRRWSQTLVDWRFAAAPWVFWASRIRHRAARLTAPWLPADRLAEAAIGRFVPELTRAAVRVPADLYIAHNLGALPAAWRAARHHGGRLGFDAEDFHSGQLSADDPLRAVTEHVERRYLPECDYITASSPGIAEAYQPFSRCGLPRCVLNVFSKADRPAVLKTGQPSLPITLYWFSQVIGSGRGLEDVVRALARTPAGSAELHVRGDWWPGYEAEIGRLAASVGLAPERIVSHPLASPDEMVRRSATYDIGLTLEPGRSDNGKILLTNKLFTYLLGGQAIIATRTSGQQWLLDQIPGAAVSYDPGDIETLTSHLLNWIARRDELTAAKRAAWTYGDRRFNWETEQHVFLNTVRTTLGTPRRETATHHDVAAGARTHAAGAR